MIRNEILLYPNPTKNHFEIRGSHIFNEVKIFDMQGKIHYHLFPRAKNILFGMDQKEIYLAILKSNKQITPRKIVVHY